MPSFKAPSKDNSLVTNLGDKRIWINWTLEQAKNTDGSPEMTKIPRRTSGGFASVSDPTSWETYAQVNEAMKEKKFSGIGIVFEDSLSLVGIDLDHYVKDGKIEDESLLLFLASADTYIEYSPSGTGLHIFFQTVDENGVAEAFDPIVKKHHKDDDKTKVIEIYSRGRYFTFTGNVFNFKPKGLPVRKVSVEEMDTLLAMLGYPWGKTASAPSESASSALAPYAHLLYSEDDVLNKMFSAKNGKKIRDLYEGDISEHGNDHSSADMALCMHLAFWTGKDPQMMKAIWMHSPLGQREKTQKRKDYVDRTIAYAIENTGDAFDWEKWSSGGLETLEGKEGKEGSEEISFICTKKGRADLITENIVRVLEHDPKFSGKFRLNEFSHMIECLTEGGFWINLVDKYVLLAQTGISIAYPDFARVSKEMITDAIKLNAANHPINPPVDWLRSLKWDGEPRLDSWLYKVYGTPDDDLHQSMGANFLKGMVNRIMNPGCQMDLVLCLEGEQGTRKSSSLRILGGEWFAENVTTVDSKDDLILFAGNILVEFSEGAVLSRYSVTKLKSVITATVDKFRPPYERGLVSFPRGCVFSLSTNDTTYLKDETGGRRFLVVSLGKVADTKWLKQNRDQLFAEALHRVRAGESTYEFSEESAEKLKELQESRTEDGAYDDVVIDWYLGRSKAVQEAGITPLQVYMEAINNEGRELSKHMEGNIRGILRRALYLENKLTARDETGKRTRRWFPSKKTRSKFKLGNETSADGADEMNKVWEEHGRGGREGREEGEEE